MRKARLVIGLALAIVAVLALSAPARAQFTAQGEKGTGSGEFIEFSLKAGGATVQCLADSEGASELTWTVLNEGKEAKKGPALTVNTKKWGECTAEAPKLASTKATVSGCELEVQEPKEETVLTAKVLKACTIEAKECVISIEPKENEKLTSFNLYLSGKENLNSVLEPNSENVATKVGSKCASLGISETKTGHLTGAVEMQQVHPQLAGQFWLTASREFFSQANPVGILLVTRAVAPAAMLTSMTFISHPGEAFTLTAADETNCRGKTYGVAESCSIGITYNWNMVFSGRADLLVSGANNIGSIIIVRGT